MLPRLATMDLTDRKLAQIQKVHTVSIFLVPGLFLKYLKLGSVIASFQKAVCFGEEGSIQSNIT